MNIVYSDLEGVLVLGIWVAFAEASGISELRRTARGEPDYDKLVHYRADILKEHDLGLREIQEIIATIDPMPGAKESLDELRSSIQAMILSDTLTQFTSPLIRELGYPTILCNSLEVTESDETVSFKMCIERSKLTTVYALQSIGYETIASGDSYNDLGMIETSRVGLLFRMTEEIRRTYPQHPMFETYAELLAAVKAVQ